MASEHSATRGSLSAGTALGLFLGLLVGLTTSSVVGTVLGIISALATAFISRPSSATDKPEPREAVIARFRFLTGFALAGALGVLGGILMRSHNCLGPAPESIRNRWVAMGLNTNDAVAVALYRSEGVQFQQKEKSISLQSSGRNSFLFSEFTSEAAEAEELDPRERSSETSLRRWDRAPNQVWRKLAAALRRVNLAEEQKTNALTEIWKELTK